MLLVHRLIAVIQGKNKRDGSSVALKIIRSTSDIDQLYFLEEIKLMKRIKHPNIVTFIGAWRNERSLYVCIQRSDYSVSNVGFYSAQWSSAKEVLLVISMSVCPHADHSQNHY